MPWYSSFFTCRYRPLGETTTALGKFLGTDKPGGERAPREGHACRQTVLPDGISSNHKWPLFVHVAICFFLHYGWKHPVRTYLR